MTLTAQQAADVVVGSVTDSHQKFGVPLSEAGTEGVSVPNSYCAIWKKAEPILQMLAGFAMWIPGFGATAAGVLNGLIKVGALIAQELACP
jgi:hypothetical protein